MACSMPGFPVLHLLPELHISLSWYKRSSGERDDFSSRLTHQIHFFSEPPFKNDVLTQCVLKECVSVRAGLELNLPFLLHGPWFIAIEDSGANTQALMYHMGLDAASNTYSLSHFGSD